jgi:hypothetical protein
MTQQISDTFQYCDAEYAVAGISDGNLFNPAVLDLKPGIACTACWRGYQAVYAILETQLVVADLYITLWKNMEGFQFHRKQGPAINGITPTEKKRQEFDLNNHYSGINHHLEYTGGLLLVDGLISSFHIHRSLYLACEYKNVIELVFENGILSREIDHSEKMAEVRQMILEYSDSNDFYLMLPNDEIPEFAECTFERTYTRIL